MTLRSNKVKIVLGAIAFVIIAQVLHNVLAMLTMDFYRDPAYFSVWSKMMMPGPGGPPAEFMYYSLAFSFVTGLIYSGIYDRVKGFMKGIVWKKGMKFGFVIFLMVGLPFFFTTYLLINLPVALLFYWLIIDGLITYLLGGIAIAWLNK